MNSDKEVQPPPSRARLNEPTARPVRSFRAQGTLAILFIELSPRQDRDARNLSKIRDLLVVSACCPGFLHRKMPEEGMGRMGHPSYVGKLVFRSALGPDHLAFLA